MKQLGVVEGIVGGGWVLKLVVFGLLVVCEVRGFGVSLGISSSGWVGVCVGGWLRYCRLCGREWVWKVEGFMLCIGIC